MTFFAIDGVVYQGLQCTDRKYFVANCNIDEPNEVTRSKAEHIAALLNESENELSMLLKGYEKCQICGGLLLDLSTHKC